MDVVGGKYTLTLPYFAATLNVTTAPDAVVTATLPTGKAYTATADSSGNASVLHQVFRHLYRAGIQGECHQ